MGNAIRLGIARVGLALTRCTKSNQESTRSPSVILILGLDKAGKTTVASLISRNQKKPISDTTYVPTNGFSIYQVKSRGGVTKLYDLGGSESIRELWKHYYSDVKLFHELFRADPSSMFSDSGVTGLGIGTEEHFPSQNLGKGFICFNIFFGARYRLLFTMDIDLTQNSQIAHGFIYVIDSASSPSEIRKSAQVFAQLLQDERVKGKPILILGNKQDVQGSLSELELTTQMDVVRLVNMAKCLTRLDTSSATNLTQLDDSDNGIYLGFRWLTSYIKWHWNELNDRVEHDSLLERSREKTKFEQNREQGPTLPQQKRGESGKSIKSFKSGQTIPALRLDPEGGNDEMVENVVVHKLAPGDDSSSEDVEMDDGVQDTSNSPRNVPEIMIVEAKVQVHKSEDVVSLSLPESEPPELPTLDLLELPPSPILETRESFVTNTLGMIDDPIMAPEQIKPAQDPSPPEGGRKPESVNKSGSRVGPPVPRRMKVFKNKTAPLVDTPTIYPNTLANKNKR